LQSFQLPTAVKGRLADSLPKHLNDLDKISSLSKFSFNLSNPLAKNNFTFGAKPDIKPNLEEAMKNTFSSVTVKDEKEKDKEAKEAKLECDKDEKEKNLTIDIPVGMETRSKSSPSISANQENAAASLVPAISSSDALRQRVLLKGPRVKHVCRSAQIVLGQPIAVFSNGDESQSEVAEKEPDLKIDKMEVDPEIPEKPEPEPIKKSEVVEEIVPEPVEEKPVITEEIPDEKSVKPEPSVIPEIPETLEENSENQEIQEETSQELPEDLIKITKPTKEGKKKEKSGKVLKKSEEIKDLVPRFEISKPITRKVTRPFLSLSQAQNLSRITSTLPSSKRLLFQQFQSQQKNINTSIPMISVDFWENYDPAEVSRTGFGLILSEKVSIKSLCFLCGSCGVDPLIYCVCCCEPYHYYCVEDGFNIKFQVNPDNLNSSDFYQELDQSGSSTHSHSNQIVRRTYDLPLHKRLNWLCPRCTVCHTCNMSTGSKVKCQKCEKNYHPTCLGTSKRLLGADRPLICAACLKCKSCGITNVTKFVGNLPMCSNCFKLRQKGNFCPLCQKCYENNDYDLKMMECGDCRRWVHAKCEGLIDEQYNLLSVLPENIEFYCKKCSENNPLANVWRDSVAAEFRSSLLSVIRLLSKSRHACALLRMSPRKKTHCSCQQKTSLFDSEFGQFFGEEKTTCQCNLSAIDLIGLNINEIKQKIIENKYHSLHAFNYDMNRILAHAQSEELQSTYSEIISEIFPWYQNETKACTDALVETMNDAGNEYLDDFQNPEETEFTLQPQPNLPDDVEKDGPLKAFLAGKDTRLCMLCKKEGEFQSQDEGRLLYCGNNTWVHTNCALWSGEIYEEIDGSLQNVQSAISRGRMIKCAKCGVKGATVGCNYKNCGENYHFMCAKESGVGFMLDKRVFCPQHLDESKNSLDTNFEVNRSVYVELDRKKKKMVEAAKVQFLMGSLYVSKLGKIVPMLSDQQDYLVPVDFECSRLYWSSKKPWQVVEYTVRVSIQRSNYPTPAFDKGVNFTVDHSTNPQLVQKNLKQISIWHSSISQAAQETAQEEKKLMISEETNDEEPQNNNDLFPPEIKDAIFEDLPHDVLDGISMFDIFPKNDGRYLENGEDEEESGDSNDSDLNGFLDNFQEDSFLRKSPSQMKRLSFFQQQQQKTKELDQKKRKLSEEQNNDTNNNKNGVEELPAAKRISTNLTMKFVNQAEIAKNLFDSKSQFCDLKIPQLDGLNDDIFQANSNSSVMCDRCRCTYRNRESFERHLPTCENMSTNESDSESGQVQNQDQNIFLSTSQSNVISMINQQQNQSIPIVINPFQGNPNIQNAISLSNAPISLQLNSDGNLGLQNLGFDQQGQQIFTAQPLNIGNFGQTILPVRNFQQNATNIPYLNTSQQFISLPANGSNGQQLVTFATSQSDMSGTNSISYTKKQLILPGNSGKNGQGKLKTTPSGQKSLLTKKKEQQVAVKNISLVNYQQQQPSAQQTTLQQPQQQQQQAQNLIFQQPNAINSQYPLILNQNGNMIQYYAPTVAQNDAQNTQLQYLPAIGGTPNKTAPNGTQIFPNAFPNNNLMLTNGLQVVPVQNQVIGTLIQPQLNQCGLMSAEQMMLAQTPTLEMVSDPTSGCMYLTSQPVYYGLETIVQNTVMSSQQFVSTAMQGVLSQNSSFSATTTQVFQASKIEPIMEIPTGYVVLNADSLGGQQQIMPQQKITQTSSVLTTPIQQASISEPCYIMEDKKDNWNPNGQPLKQGKQKVVPKISKIQPQLVSKVTPTNHETIQKVINNEEKLKMTQQFVAQQQPIQAQYVKVQKKPVVKNTYRAIGPKTDDPSVKSAYIKPKVASKPIEPKVQHIVTDQHQLKMGEIQTLDQTYRTVQNNMIVQANKVQKAKEIECQSLANIPTNVVNPMQTQNTIFSNLNTSQTKNKQSVNNRPTNRVLPMQQRVGIAGKGKAKNTANVVTNPAPIHQQIQEVKENYSEKIKSIAMELQSNKNDALFDRLRMENPQNNLSPQNSNGYLGSLVCDKTIEDSLSPQPLVIDVRTTTQTTTTLSPSTTTSPYLVPSTSSASDIQQTRMIAQEISPVSNATSSENCLVIEEKMEEKPEEKLETILQEISKEKLSPIDFDEPSSTSNNLDENSTRNSLDDEDSEFKDPIQYSKASSISTVSNIMCDVQQQKSPQKVAPAKVTGPKILFEIQSEDGFTYKSTSITEIWEKLFETVQLARKAHGLMPLPEGRLSEMTGDQMLGLKTNALKYLLEQLPGVEKCSKYTPKYHKSSSVGSSSVASSTATSATSMATYNNNFSSISSNSSNSNSNLSSASSVLSASMSSLNQYLLSDSDEMLFENIYGAARFEPYSSRSEYDMFSWLASRHRKQPVPVIVPNQNEENLIMR
jgi:histone-lysine N-methyltransferase MLL1